MTRDERGRFVARVVPLLAIGLDRIEGHHVLTREVLPARTPRTPTAGTEWTVPLWQICAWCALSTALTVASHLL